jgi:O-antigen/teichoic acid export membrane protein
LSLQRDIVANYVSQIYVTMVGIVMVPMYVRYMGTEAYGLVGFFAMLQAWFQLLDVGLTPTMVRETARFRGGALDAMELRRLLRALEGIFFCLALCGALAMAAGSERIAGGWLKVERLPLDEVENAIVLMGAAVALRWVGGLYRGAINGFQRLVWLSGFNGAVATARFVLVVPFLVYVGASPTDFFSYQLAVALIETAVLVGQTYRLLPDTAAGQRIRWEWAPLRRVLGFALSIAFTTSIWVVVTQTDKLVLSRLLPLEEYAYFTLAVLMSSGVIFISAPISSALLPRLNALASKRADEELYDLYRQGTQIVALIAFPAAAVLAAFPEEVLWVWTGNGDIARHAAPILALYAAGTGLMAVSSFPAHLQVAKGDLRLHVIGAALFLVLLVPMLIWATWKYGAIGAGYAWLVMNLLYFLVWVPKVHRRFRPGLHAQWLKTDVACILIFSTIGAVSARYLFTWSGDRMLAAAQLAMMSAAILAIGALGSPLARQRVLGTLQWRGSVAAADGNSRTP